MKRTYYDILRVAPDAETEVITAAYRALMSKLKKHPDLGGDEVEATLINRAYEILSDSKERSVYDTLLAKSVSEKTKDKKNEKKSYVERRRAPRHDVDSVVSFCVNHDTRWYPARVKDVSILGVKIQSHAALAVGQHLVIIPPNLASSAVHGTVRWARMFHPSVFERVYEAGIEFADQITDIDRRFSV